MATQPARDILRQHLRASTAQAHDRLDTAMRRASGWTTRCDYVRFLNLQYAARKPVEVALDSFGRTHGTLSQLPPPQSPLIAKDIAEMGANLPKPAQAFTLPALDSSAATLGVAWVLAGSALGNRAILKDVRNASPSRSPWPENFLGDEAMLRFWSRLRRQLEYSASAEEMRVASDAATAVFDHFICTAETAGRPAVEGAIA